MIFLRIKLKEINLTRIVKAIIRRLGFLPHKITWNFSGQGKKNRKKIESFYNIHKNQRCFLIANGPSIKKTDLSYLKNEITFGMNRIYLLNEKTGFKPSYYVCVNKLVLEQFADEISLIECPKFINWHSRKFFGNANNCFFIEKNFFGKSFGKNMSNSINPASTVTYAALQVIYYMGFKEVIIVGMDHTFDYSGKPNEKQVRTKEDSNHFDPNYFPKGSKWETPDLVSSEYFYKIARNEFEKDNRKIFDATIDGKCPVFTKKEYNEIIKNI